MVPSRFTWDVIDFESNLHERLGENKMKICTSSAHVEVAWPIGWDTGLAIWRSRVEVLCSDHQLDLFELVTGSNFRLSTGLSPAS